MTTTNAPPSLSLSDAGAIVALIGEVCADQGGHAARKRRLLDGICRLVDARAWVWGLFVQLKPREFPSYFLHLHGGFDEEQLSKYLQALEHPETQYFTAPFARALQEKQCHITRMRQQLADQDEYLASQCRLAWQASGVEPGILSSRPIDATTLSTVAIYRVPDAPLFTERELRIAHIVLTEVPWLHEQGWPDDRAASVPALSPRRCTVLNFLVHGRSRQDIAEHLEISRETLDGYVKDLYRHFGVHSQPELMARFQHGDCGDQA